MRLIRPKDYRRMPWKNGGGETIEIAVFPKDADTSGFDWRVSMAKVESEGPFSAFPGIDRTLTILDGAGLELSVEGYPLTIVAAHPHSFPGDLPTWAKLLDGPVTDLNVMTRRGRFGHRVTPVELNGAQDFVIRSSVALVYCQRGTATVDEEFAAPIMLEQGQTLYVESMPNSLRLISDAGCRLLLIEINRIG
jgi:environmental stress-induced protein Ves